MALLPTCFNNPNIVQDPPFQVEALPDGHIDGISLAAFNQLVLAHQDDAFNFAFYLLGDPDVAADIVQKSFLNAYLNIEKFHGPSFRSWLFKIIKNASIDEFRSASYRRNSSLDAIEDEEEWRYLPGDQETPEESIEKMEREQAIHNALNHLEEPFRTILILVDIQGFDYEEAAQIAGIPVGTAKSRLSRARIKLRSEISELIGAF
jgi:RNA polymerase sigma-70 factor (ECF subfamily)